MRVITCNRLLFVIAQCSIKMFFLSLDVMRNSCHQLRSIRCVDYSSRYTENGMSVVSVVLYKIMYIMFLFFPAKVTGNDSAILFLML